MLKRWITTFDPITPTLLPLPPRPPVFSIFLGGGWGVGSHDHCISPLQPLDFEAAGETSSCLDMQSRSALAPAHTGHVVDSPVVGMGRFMP